MVEAAEAAARVDGAARGVLNYWVKSPLADPLGLLARSLLFPKMDVVLAQLGDLIVRSLPTLFLVLLLHFYLKAVFYGPLEKALADRKEATTGTRKAADEALKAAEAKAAEYEAKIRDARGQIYKEQEAIRTQLRQQQAAAVAAVKAHSDGAIREARATVAAEVADATAGLASRGEQLASQIAQAVLAGRP